MKKLIVIADLGSLKAYRVIRNENDPSPVFELAADTAFADAHQRVLDRVTDQAGRFPSGGQCREGGGMSYGERHNEAEEVRKAQLRKLAGEINALARTEQCRTIYLAAPKTINNRLLDLLDSAVRPCVRRNLALDLTKAPKLELLRRFEEAGS